MGDAPCGRREGRRQLHRLANLREPLPGPRHPTRAPAVPVYLRRTLQPQRAVHPDPALRQECSGCSWNLLSRRRVPWRLPNTPRPVLLFYPSTPVRADHAHSPGHAPPSSSTPPRVALPGPAPGPTPPTSPATPSPGRYCAAPPSGLTPPTPPWLHLLLTLRVGAPCCRSHLPAALCSTTDPGSRFGREVHPESFDSGLCLCKHRLSF